MPLSMEEVVEESKNATVSSAKSMTANNKIQQPNSDSIRGFWSEDLNPRILAGLFRPGSYRSHWDQARPAVWPTRLEDPMPADLVIPDLGLRPEMILDAYERLAGGYAPQTVLDFYLETRILENPQRKAFYEVVRHVMEYLREFGWGERQFVRSGFAVTTNLRYRVEIPEVVRGGIFADPGNALQIAFPETAGRMGRTNQPRAW